jgi:sec-independent protein translocase protein TatB
MFDVGWSEMVVIGAVALIVVGPKDLPAMFRNAGQMMAKVRGLGREFQRTMEAAARESGIDEVSKALNPAGNFGLDAATKSARDFARSMTSPAPVKKAVTPAAGAAAVSADKGAPPATETQAKAEPVRKPVTRKPAAKAAPEKVTPEKAAPKKAASAKGSGKAAGTESEKT